MLSIGTHYCTCLLLTHLMSFPSYLVFIIHCGKNFCCLRYDSKTSTCLFFLLHNFLVRRFILAIVLSNLSILFFFSLLSQECLLLHFNKALYSYSLVYPNYQHHYSCTLGWLLSKIRINWTKILWYQHSQHDNWDGY